MLLLLALQTAHASENPALVRLSEAIRFPTISYEDHAKRDIDAFNGFLSFLEKSFPNATALEEARISGYSVIYRWPGTDSSLKPVLIDAHYDVVPVEPGTEEDWRFDAFSGELKDGYVLGRGTLDNKNAVMASFEAIESLIAAGYQPARTLYYTLCHDEEIGGVQGAANMSAYFAEKGITFEYMLGEGGIVLEEHPLVPDQRVVMVNLAQKGFLTLVIAAEGEGGHSSSPVDNNALVTVADAVSKLHKNPMDPVLVSPVSDMLEGLGSHIDGVTGWLLRNQWLSSGILADQLDQDPLMRSLVRTTTAVTMFNSGIKANVIPQRAEAKVNFRLLPGDTAASVIKKVEQIIDDDRVTVTSLGSNVIPRVADKHAVGYQVLKASVARVMPDALFVPGLLMATTDTRHYETLTDNVYHFQPIFTRLEDARGVHGTNEKILASDYLESIDLMKSVLRSSTGADYQ